MSAELYVVLGVSRSATQAEIKKAYRQIARKFHPDKNPGDEAAADRFAAGAEAYRVLGDVELRIQYDRYGERAANAAARPAQSAPENPADVFRDIFGTSPRSDSSAKPRAHSRPHAGPSSDRTGRAPSRGGRGDSSTKEQGDRQKPPFSGKRPGARSAQERGDDLRYTLNLRLEDLAFGCEKVITIPRKERCGHCAGTGAQPGTAPVICQGCGGTGDAMDASGFFSTRKPCTQCDGTGKQAKTACRSCEGAAVVTSHVSIEVTVPEGIEVGTRLRIRDEGELGRGGGPRGDLYVVVQMQAHPFFKREKNDVLVEVPIRFDQAAMGATIEVPSLEGRVRMRIPAGSQSGREFRLKGKGFPLSSGRARGDQRVRIVVEVPAYLSAEQRSLLDRYAQLEGDHQENPLVRDYLQALEDYF